MSVKHFTILPLSVLFLSACSRAPEVRTYTEVTQGIPQSMASSSLPEGHPALPAGPGGMAGREGEVPPPHAATDLVWTTPAGWKEMPGSGMRLASFVAEGQPDVLCTLIVLGGMAGSTESNVSRWRGQVGLPPADPAPLAKMEGALPFLLVDVQAEAVAAGTPTSLLGTIYEQAERTIFLKLTAPTAVLESQREAFLSLARSLNVREEAR